MPTLRMSPDNSLAETLGNLGSALGNALNPMNQIRAQDIRQQVLQRQFDLQRQQQIDAANANAAIVLQNANPLNENPSDLAAHVARVRSGTDNPATTIEALKTAGGYAANQAAANLIDIQHPEWSPAQRASAKADILGGRKNLSQIEEEFANAGIAANKSTAIQAATDAARNAAASSVSPANQALAAEAAASGDPTAAGKIIAQSQVLGAPVISGALGDPEIQRQIDLRRTQQAIAGITPPAGEPVSAGLAAPAATADITRKNLGTQAAPRAPGDIVPAVPPTDPLTGQPVSVAPGAPPPPGAFSQVGQGPNAAATAETSRAATMGTELAKTDEGAIVGAITAGNQADTAQAMLDRIAAYAPLLDNRNWVGQGMLSLGRKLAAEAGINVNNATTAYQAIDQTVRNMLPELRAQFGFQRVAQPEIVAAMSALPRATDAPAAFLGMIGWMRSEASLNQQLRDLAWEERAKPGGLQNQANIVDFAQKRQQLVDEWKRNSRDLATFEANQLREGGSAPPAPAPRNFTATKDPKTGKLISVPVQ